MKYSVIITYQDGGQIKTYRYEYEAKTAYGPRSEIDVLYREIQHKGGVDIPDGQAVERVAIGQIHKVRIEPIAETPALEIPYPNGTAPITISKKKSKTQFSHTLGGGG